MSLSSPITNINRQAAGKRRYNVICASTHERQQTMQCRANADFFSVQLPGFKPWVREYAEVPENYTFLPESNNPIPLWLDFDVVLSQNKAAQFPPFRHLAQIGHVNLIHLEHCLPTPNTTREEILGLKRDMSANFNLFISEYNANAWGYSLDEPNTRVIHHAIDHDLFKPDGPRQPKILCVVNDWQNREWCCNFSGGMRLLKNLPHTIMGDNPGISKPAANPTELAKIYASHEIFLNTSLISPVPTALLEAMAAGCAVVSTATCMIPSILVNGVNGLISNNEKELRGFLEDLIADPDYAAELGKAARETIIRDFSPSRFIREWNELFDEVAASPFLGL